MNQVDVSFEQLEMPDKAVINMQQLYANDVLVRVLVVGNLQFLASVLG